MSLFGKNIKKIRSVRGLTQAQLAEMIEVSRGVVSSYEEGRAEPKIETILKTADTFGLSVDYLLKNILTVNQLSGFSLPDVATKSQHKANSISKLISEFNSLNQNYQFILKKTLQVVAQPWAKFEGYFIVQSSPKAEAVFVIETDQKSYLGMVQKVTKDHVTIADVTIFVKTIQFSGKVIGGYTAFPIQNSLENRVQNLESQLEKLNAHFGTNF
jgi:transcriptional regulator with XRE-family HTH domain